jgi:hypothetical protein
LKTGTVSIVSLSITIALSAQQQRFNGRSWWHHIQVLADDNMEGRGTGTPGLQRAEAYVVDQLKKTDLIPAGVDGYYQPVSLESREIVEEDCEAVLVHAGTSQPLVLGKDAYFSALVDLAPAVDAPLVFVGYGLNVPEKNLDDFAGLSLKGKVAVAIPAVPDGIDGAVAVLANSRRQHQYPETGLAGWIWLVPPTANWSSSVAAARSPVMDLPKAGDGTDQQIRMSLQSTRADALFEGTGHTVAELLALANDHKPLPHFDLPFSIHARTHTQKKRVASANVIAKLEGSDPRLKHEYIVLSAHIDHLGVGEPVNGDRIYNGAIDNASGVATVLDIAEEFKREGVRPRRSVLFAFFTGEEKGILGSKYFIAHPTVDVQSIVGDVNVDGVMAFTPLTSVFIEGQHDSSLGDAARRAISSQNVTSTSDPNNRSIASSDQYSFIERDIPAVRLLVDFPGESRKVIDAWERDRVHKPSDDLFQPVDRQAAAKFEEIIWQLVLDIGNDVHRPEWKPTSIYHQRYRAR